WASLIALSRASTNASASLIAFFRASSVTFSIVESVRSEERRVGKECRYWRDWSSDVCSSDLLGFLDRLVAGFDERLGVLDRLLPGVFRHVLDRRKREIGRASCRERV